MTPNNRLESARVARPTRKGVAPLLAAQPESYAPIASVVRLSHILVLALSLAALLAGCAAGRLDPYTVETACGPSQRWRQMDSPPDARDNLFSIRKPKFVLDGSAKSKRRVGEVWFATESGELMFCSWKKANTSVGWIGVTDVVVFAADGGVWKVKEETGYVYVD
jgi:hypothetical protein